MQLGVYITVKIREGRGEVGGHRLKIILFFYEQFLNKYEPKKNGGGVLAS